MMLHMPPTHTINPQKILVRATLNSFPDCVPAAKTVMPKNEIHVFCGYLSLQKMKLMFFEVFKLAKNEIHVF